MSRERRAILAEEAPHPNPEWQLGFDQGFVCACAAIVSAHGEETIAKDILRMNEPDDWNCIDDYDRDILVEVGLAPKKRKGARANSVQKP